MHGKLKTQALAGEYTSQSRSATSPFGKTSLNALEFKKRLTPE